MQPTFLARLSSPVDGKITLGMATADSYQEVQQRIISQLKQAGIPEADFDYDVTSYRKITFKSGVEIEIVRLFELGDIAHFVSMLLARSQE